MLLHQGHGLHSAAEGTGQGSGRPREEGPKLGGGLPREEANLAARESSPAPDSEEAQLHCAVALLQGLAGEPPHTTSAWNARRFHSLPESHRTASAAGPGEEQRAPSPAHSGLLPSDSSKPRLARPTALRPPLKDISQDGQQQQQLQLQQLPPRFQPPPAKVVGPPPQGNPPRGVPAQAAAPVARRFRGGCPTSSSYRGVSWHKRGRKWRAAIYIDGKASHLGYFLSQAKAALAYDEHARRMGRPEWQLNFPQGAEGVEVLEAEEELPAAWPDPSGGSDGGEDREWTPSSPERPSHRGRKRARLPSAAAALYDEAVHAVEGLEQLVESHPPLPPAQAQAVGLPMGHGAAAVSDVGECGVEADGFGGTPQEAVLLTALRMLVASHKQVLHEVRKLAKRPYHAVHAWEPAQPAEPAELPTAFSRPGAPTRHNSGGAVEAGPARTAAVQGFPCEDRTGTLQHSPPAIPQGEERPLTWGKRAPRSR